MHDYITTQVHSYQMTTHQLMTLACQNIVLFPNYESLSGQGLPNDYECVYCDMVGMQCLSIR